MKIHKRFFTVCLLGIRFFRFVKFRSNIDPTINHKNWETVSLLIHELRKLAHMLHADVSQIEMCTLFINRLSALTTKYFFNRR